MITRPYTRPKGLKTVPSPAAHTCIANIWQYPPGNSEWDIPLDNVASYTFCNNILLIFKACILSNFVQSIVLFLLFVVHEPVTAYFFFILLSCLKFVKIKRWSILR